MKENDDDNGTQEKKTNENNWNETENYEIAWLFNSYFR